jgi:alanine racemase
MPAAHDHLVWAEIDLGALAHNVGQLRRATRPEARLMVAVKADAYGHGAVPVARRALESGADALGVARLPEALALREAGIQAPILVFGYTPPAQTQAVVANDLIQTVYDPQTARAYDAAARQCKGRMRIHLKVDTGMGRLGMLPDDRRCPPDGPAAATAAIEEARAIAALSNLNLEGVFTHFASSDSADKSYTQWQFENFRDFLARLQQAGLTVSVRHAANSGAIIDLPQTHLDMVRAGISLYGLYPSDEVDRGRIDLKPVLSLKARIIHLKCVPTGTSISYGMTFTTSQSTVIATVPIGYADGYSRLLSNRGHMLVRGRRAPIVGRVCMDLTMLDVGHIDAVAMEDEVVAIGRQEDEEISADEIAAQVGTINYEVTAALTGRVPRVFI